MIAHSWSSQPGSDPFPSTHRLPGGIALIILFDVCPVGGPDGAIWLEGVGYFGDARLQVVCLWSGAHGSVWGGRGMRALAHGHACGAHIIHPARVSPLACVIGHLAEAGAAEATITDNPLLGGSLYLICCFGRMVGTSQTFALLIMPYQT